MKKQKNEPIAVETAGNVQPVAATVTADQPETVVVETVTKKPHKAINTIINVILVIAIIIAAVCTYVSFVTTSGNGVPSIFGLRLLSIKTDSMYPEILSGDLIIDTPIKDPADLRKEDIITFWTVINGERVLNTHRIENIYDGEGYLIFETKGDANSSVDPLTVHESELVGKYKLRIPGVGKVFDYLQTTEGFLLVVVIPVFLFFVYHLIQFFRVLFEYQNVKNRIKFEQERAQAESISAKQIADAVMSKEAERAAIEAELREKLRAELLESMKAEAAGEEKVKEPAAEKAETKVEAEPDVEAVAGTSEENEGSEN